MQWVVRNGDLVVKSRVHDAANLAGAPQSCWQSSSAAESLQRRLYFVSKLDRPRLGNTYAGNM
eukprot:1142310-Pelagomonas_calceolata.AAC.4